MAIGFTYKGDLTCALGVSNLDAAIKWYTDVLGFTLLYRDDNLKWCEMTTGVKDVTVGLGEREKVSAEGGATLVFGVTDIDAARAEVEGKGVRFDGKTMVIPGLVKLATFFDPDGNKFMFSQSLQ